MDLTQHAKLTKEQIKEYIKEGFHLNEEKTYVIKFLFNDKWNRAGDPRPFRIKTELIDDLAKDAIGMPYVINTKNPKFHVRGTTEGKEDTTENLLDVQRLYSVGYIVTPIKTKDNNVYGIIEIFPEYENNIDEFPDLVSPTITPIKEDQEGISEAMFVNINGITENSGYPQLLTQTNGVCKGGIKECMLELMPLASSGQLKEYRQRIQETLSKPIGAGNAMSAEPQADPPASTESKDVRDLNKEVDDIKADITKLNEGMSAISKTVDTIAQKVGVGSEDKPTPDEPLGASAHAELVKVNKELKEIKTDYLQLKEQREAEIRKDLATKIVETLKVPEAERESMIKKYINAKDDKGNPRDLQFALETLKAVPTTETKAEDEKPLGASALFPELTGDKDATPSISTLEVTEMF